MEVDKLTEKLVGICWSNGRLFNVRTNEAGYDVYYSKAHDTYYFHNSGHGGEHRDGYTEQTGCIDTFQELVELFGMAEGKCSWCEKCESMFPRRDLCEHLEWNEEGIVVDEEGNEV